MSNSITAAGLAKLEYFEVENMRGGGVCVGRTAELENCSPDCSNEIATKGSPNLKKEAWWTCFCHFCVPKNGGLKVPWLG
jgi:hypothetical protein